MNRLPITSTLRNSMGLIKSTSRITPIARMNKVRSPGGAGSVRFDNSGVYRRKPKFATPFSIGTPLRSSEKTLHTQSWRIRFRKETPSINPYALGLIPSDKPLKWNISMYSTVSWERDRASKSVHYIPIPVSVAVLKANGCWKIEALGLQTRFTSTLRCYTCRILTHKSYFFCS